MKNPSILQEFERRLEGAVEGFFARAFRSGLQPVELAKGVRRYAEQQRQVAADAVVVPNAYRFRVNPKDADRLAGFGDRLVRELAAVVEQTARDEAWALAGPVSIEVAPDPEIAYGMFRLVGRVDAQAQAPAEPEPPVDPQPPTDEPPTDEPPTDGPAQEAAPARSPTPVPAKAGAPRKPANLPKTGQPPATKGGSAKVDVTGAMAAVGATTPTLVLPGGHEVALKGARLVAGRLDDNAITIDHATVSRAHAAFVKRGEEWWVLDLGSTNGTRVNGRPAAEHPIRPGDEVELGEVVLEVVER